MLSSYNACNNNLSSVVLSLFVPYKFVFVFKVFKCECSTATARFSCCTLVTGQIMIAHSVAICFNLLTSKCGYNLISSKRQQFSLALNMTFRKRPHATASSAAATTTTFTILVSLFMFVPIIASYTYPLSLKQARKCQFSFLWICQRTTKSALLKRTCCFYIGFFPSTKCIKCEPRKFLNRILTNKCLSN